MSIYLFVTWTSNGVARKEVLRLGLISQSRLVASSTRPEFARSKWILWGLCISTAVLSMYPFQDETGNTKYVLIKLFKTTTPEMNNHLVC